METNKTMMQPRLVSCVLFLTMIAVLEMALPTAAQTYDQFKQQCYSHLIPTDQVIQSCDEVISREPNDNFAFSSRGVSYYRKGDFDQAIKDFDEAIRLKPKNPYSYFNRGLAYYYKGEFDHAIQDYDEVLRLDPTFGVVHNRRGLAYFGKGEFDRAIQDYDEAIDRSPGKDDPDATANRAAAVQKRDETK